MKIKCMEVCRRTHFMLFAGVTCPKSPVLLRRDLYVASLPNSLESVAVPKYSFPAAFARVFSLAVEVAVGADEEAEGEPPPAEDAA